MPIPSTTLGIADNFVGPQSVWLTANETTIYAFVNIDVAQGPVVIEIPPGAIVGLLDDFWQRSLADVGLLRFVNVARPRAPHRAAGMRPRRQPWVALHESGDRHSRTRHHHGVAPGWPIAHPLVAEGRAAVFWPNPSGDRLRAALGEVHPTATPRNMAQRTASRSWTSPR
jgi:hypothetical protein